MFFYFTQWLTMGLKKSEVTGISSSNANDKITLWGPTHKTAGPTQSTAGATVLVLLKKNIMLTALKFIMKGLLRLETYTYHLEFGILFNI